jgi:hypothetical protein
MIGKHARLKSESVKAGREYREAMQDVRRVIRDGRGKKYFSESFTSLLTSDSASDTMSVGREKNENGNRL